MKQKNLFKSQKMKKIQRIIYNFKKNLIFKNFKEQLIKKTQKMDTNN